MSNMYKLCTVIFAGALAMSACVLDVGTSDRSAEGDDVGDGDGDEPGDCDKIEGSQIGVEGIAVTAGAITVRFVDWQSKQGEPGELVGFSLQIRGGTPDVYVKAGGQVYGVSGSTWSHPGGIAGPDANAISNVEVCDPDPGDPDPGDPDPGDDGECDDPNGCDDEECNDPDGCDDSQDPYVE